VARIIIFSNLFTLSKQSRRDAKIIERWHARYHNPEGMTYLTKLCHPSGFEYMSILDLKEFHTFGVS